jgi:hypothetical protein
MESAYKISYIKTKEDYDNLCNNQQGGDNIKDMLYALMAIIIIIIGISLFASRKGQRWNVIEDYLGESFSRSLLASKSNKKVQRVLDEEAKAKE